MKLLIVAATPFEIAPLKQFLDEQFVPFAEGQYQKGELQVSLLITGVGSMLTAFHLGSALSIAEFNLAINAGVAGAFDQNLAIGDVVQVHSEQLGDLGVEEADGQFTDLFELELLQSDQGPFTSGKLLNPNTKEQNFLPSVSSLTVNTVHGYPPSIDKIQEKYQVQIESMEGGAFFYACLVHQVAFLEIRAISNYVEARNKENWDLPLSIKRLNEVLIEMVATFTK